MEIPLAWLITHSCHFPVQTPLNRMKKNTAHLLVIWEFVHLSGIMIIQPNPIAIGGYIGWRRLKWDTVNDWRKEICFWWLDISDGFITEFHDFEYVFVDVPLPQQWVTHSPHFAVQTYLKRPKKEEQRALADVKSYPAATSNIILCTNTLGLNVFSRSLKPIFFRVEKNKRTRESG